jgi:hypothetical protein
MKSYYLKNGGEVKNYNTFSRCELFQMTQSSMPGFLFSGTERLSLIINHLVESFFIFCFELACKGKWNMRQLHTV